MATSAVETLKNPEYGRLWDRFHREFAFRSGMTSATWPAIKEPVDSVTWSLGALDDDPGHRRLDGMVAAVKAGLWACTPPEGTLLVLDWQHRCYRIRPHHLTAAHAPKWPASMMPDGDYNIHLAEDFSFGTFGHPWEYTICVMGESLLAEVADALDRILLRRVRESGTPVPGPTQTS
ncbi:DUF2716 domain-containing protein [Actinoplanes sp. NPDC026623]|uniref:DUF2716 domain-containing protein n=1 Tax=Actinoplanes sp. NPDC026623 TaxID=3155610 RepID=UPI0033CD865E